MVELESPISVWESPLCHSVGPGVIEAGFICKSVVTSVA